MLDLAERWAKLWSFVQGRSAEVIRSIPIPSERVFEGESWPEHFDAGRHYFSVVINEVFIMQARQWFSVYDPMALVVSEFTYDGKRTTVPFIVGPSLIKGKVSEVPQGITINDTQVAGVHPYPGGKLALTVILAQVKRDDYAKRLLRVVENVARAFPVGTALEPHLEVASALLDGVESIFDMSDTKPLIGHRWEYNDGTTRWMKPGCYALLNLDEEQATKLSVVGGRLHKGVDRASPAFRDANYLLYSLCCLDARSDLTELSFYPLFESALRDAASVEDGAWARAKATLIAVYKEMLTSPDLTWSQIEQLFDRFKSQLVAAKENAAAFGKLGLPQSSASSNTDQRVQKLREIHKILEL